MNSHTIPRRLLEQFAYPDQRTRSLRLWRYRKSANPRSDAAPKTASRIPGYFAHSQDAEREIRLERRLNAEIEDPVHKILPELCRGELRFDDQLRRKLGRYVLLLFSRSRARRHAMAITQALRHKLMRESMDCPICMQTLATKWNLDAHSANPRPSVLITPNMVKEALLPKLIEATSAIDQQDSFSSWIEHLLRPQQDEAALVSGRWMTVSTEADNPFLLSDSPVVSFSRLETGISWGDGFNKPTVEIIMPISPTTCLHVAPAQNKRECIVPTTKEINHLQATFVQESGYADRYSQELQQLVAAHAQTAKIGVNCFRVNPQKIRYYFLDAMLAQNASAAFR